MSFFRGGKKSRGKNNIKRKIKNITKLYKMRSKKRAKSIKKKLINKYSNNNEIAIALASGGKRRRTKRNRRISQKGGYSQYQNNLPMTPTYSTGGVLSAANLGLANPVPYQVLSNCTNCVDNYNAYEMKGFPSRGP